MKFIEDITGTLHNISEVDKIRTVEGVSYEDGVIYSNLQIVKKDNSNFTICSFNTLGRQRDNEILDILSIQGKLKAKVLRELKGKLASVSIIQILDREYDEDITVYEELVR